MPSSASARGTRTGPCNSQPIMRIALGADHAGYAFKTKLAQKLEALGHDVKDFGTNA